MTARFLGWRESEGLGRVAAGQAPAQRQPGESKKPSRAKWSDDAGFGQSDGFNIAKWRAECEADIREVEAAGRWRLVRQPVDSPRVGHSPRRTARLEPLKEEDVSTLNSSGPLISRGEMTEALARERARESLATERANRRAAAFAEAAREHRRLAAQWRDSKEHGHPINGKKKALHAYGVSPDSEGGEDALKKKRTEECISRIKAMTHAIVNAARFCSTDTTSSDKDHGDQDNPEEVEETPSDMKELRTRVKHAVTTRLQQRRRHARKVLKRKEIRKAAVMDIPDTSRRVFWDSFSLYSDESGRLAIESLWKALAGVGLRGSGPRERSAVDATVQTVACMLAEENKKFESARSVTVVDAEHMQRWVDFEEFCSEVVCACRTALSLVRQDMHFTQFLRVLEDCSSVFLDRDQFRLLAEHMGIREKLVDEALDALDEPRRDLVSPDSPRANRESRVDRVAIEQLDFETVHKMLMEMEEREEQHRHKMELRIKDQKGIPEDRFWKYKSELVRLHAHFNGYDGDRSGRVGYKEIKMLLHSLGLQPYKLKHVDTVDRYLKDCDPDKMESLTFYEFLELISKFRQYQKSSRESRLRREFGRQVKQQGRVHELELDSILVVLGTVGICGKTSEERDMITKLVHDVQVSCDVVIHFRDFEDLCQRIVESLQCLRVEDHVLVAESLGIDKTKLVPYQFVFEQLSANDSGGITQEDFGKALFMLLARPPPKPEVDFLFENLQIDPEEQISWKSYLQLLQMVYVGKSGWVSKELPFTLRRASDVKLREILRMFSLSEDYISQVTSEELPELVGGYLRVKPDADLRVAGEPGKGLSQAISNVGQLMNYAAKESDKTMRPSRSSTIMMPSLSAILE